VKAVINGKLFSRPDFAKAVQKDLAADRAHCQIRIATVVDEFGAAPTNGTIELKALIQADGVDAPSDPCRERPDGTAHGFSLADAFAGVLNDALAGRDRFFGEHAEAFDARAADAKLEAGELRVETRNVMLDGHICERVPDGNLQQPLKNDNLLLAGQWLGVLQRLGLPELLGRFFRCHSFSPSSSHP
jgi:hypothetical protein